MELICCCSSPCLACRASTSDRSSSRRRCCASSCAAAFLAFLAVTSSMPSSALAMTLAAASFFSFTWVLPMLAAGFGAAALVAGASGAEPAVAVRLGGCREEAEQAHMESVSFPAALLPA